MSKHENPVVPVVPAVHGAPVVPGTHGSHGAPAVSAKSVSGVAADLTALDKKIAELKATPGALDAKGVEALVEAQKASATLRDKINPPNKPTLSELAAPAKALNHQLQIMPPTLNAESKKSLDVIQAAAAALQGKVGG